MGSSSALFNQVVGISFTFGKPTANVYANIGTIYKVAIIWNTKSLQQHFFK